MRGKDQGVSMLREVSRSLGIAPRSIGERERNSWRGVDKTTYFLLPRVSNIFIGLEKRPYIDRLSSPDVSVDSPVQGELQ